MAGNQINFDNLLYVDDNGVSWTKRGEIGGAATAIDGHATSTSAPTWFDSSRMKVRRILFKHTASGRTIKPIFYTAAAYAAVDLGDVITPAVEGLATSPDFAAVKKLAEKQPQRATASVHLADIT